MPQHPKYHPSVARDYDMEIGRMIEDLQSADEPSPAEYVWVIRDVGRSSLTCSKYEPQNISPDAKLPNEAVYADFMEAWEACLDIDDVERILKE